MLCLLNTSGHSNDPCRTAECLWDKEDCDNACATGKPCSNILTSWLILENIAGKSNVVELNHSFVCSNAWDLALTLFEGDNEYTQDCQTTLEFFDFNGDSWTNFREFTTLAGCMSGGWCERWVGVNCSGCLGMENYNPYHGS